MKDDVIYRQAAIDAKQEFRNPNVVRSTEARTAYDRTYANGWNDCNSAWIDVVKDLPSAQPEQRWIPWDSGKFPEESGTYIVTAYDGATRRVTYAKYQKRLKRWELTGARAYWRVLAWMPLPEPYRGGEK